MGAAVLALLGAASWGVGDFLGGVASRRAHVLAVLVVSQFVGLVGAATWTAVQSTGPPELADVLPALAAGAAGAIGLGALYRGMAVGAMGIVAPISAASPVIPLAVDVAHGKSPSGLQWAGIGAVLCGIVLLAHEPRGERGSGLAAGVGLAIVAALGFGLFIVALDVAADASVHWTILAARSASTVLALAAAVSVSAAVPPAPALIPTIVAVGFFDTLANVAVAYATTQGSAGVVAVLSALYPVTTVLLARLVLSERLAAKQRLGGGFALGGAALVAVG